MNTVIVVLAKGFKEGTAGAAEVAEEALIIATHGTVSVIEAQHSPGTVVGAVDHRGEVAPGEECHLNVAIIKAIGTISLKNIRYLGKDQNHQLLELRGQVIEMRASEGVAGEGMMRRALNSQERSPRKKR